MELMAVGTVEDFEKKQSQKKIPKLIAVEGNSITVDDINSFYREEKTDSVYCRAFRQLKKNDKITILDEGSLDFLVDIVKSYIATGNTKSELQSAHNRYTLGTVIACNLVEDLIRSGETDSDVLFLPVTPRGIKHLFVTAGMPVSDAMDIYAGMIAVLSRAEEDKRFGIDLETPDLLFGMNSQDVATYVINESGDPDEKIAMFADDRDTARVVAERSGMRYEPLAYGPTLIPVMVSDMVDALLAKTE